MKKTIITTIIVVFLASVFLIVFVRLTSRDVKQESNFAEAKNGNFEITVSGTGELVADRSVDVRGPNIVQNLNFRVAPIKILDIVPEGTMVKMGEYIASLDKTAFNNTFKDESENLNKIQTSFEMKLLDTAVILSTLRDDIINQNFAKDEAEIAVAQSKYEPPATQRLAELELDKSVRYLDYKRRLYYLKHAQLFAEIKNLKSSLAIQRRKVNDLNQVLKGFTIKAPSEGMVTYKKDRLGIKRKAGSFMNPFDLVVATLPDLSVMLSRTYVSEVEVNKVKPGLPVQISVDAYQGKSYTGQVKSIANIGEQLPNSDSKVFEVLVRLDGSDPMLKPSMTTSNKVITRSFHNVVYVPIESVQAGNDSIPYVYTKEGKKQVVVLGEANEKNIIIDLGLSAGTSVWLTTPQKYQKYLLAGTELIPVIKEREKARKLKMASAAKESKLLSESMYRK